VKLCFKAPVTASSCYPIYEVICKNLFDTLLIDVVSYKVIAQFRPRNGKDRFSSEDYG
jgi:hypothetical protein